jgi:hypothetical protein
LTSLIGTEATCSTRHAPFAAAAEATSNSHTKPRRANGANAEIMQANAFVQWQRAQYPAGMLDAPPPPTLPRLFLGFLSVGM